MPYCLRYKYLKLVSFLVLAALLAACGRGETPEATPVPSETAAATSIRVSPTPQPSPTGTPVEGPAADVDDGYPEPGIVTPQQTAPALGPSPYPGASTPASQPTLQSGYPGPGASPSPAATGAGQYPLPGVGVTAQPTARTPLATQSPTAGLPVSVTGTATTPPSGSPTPSPTERPIATALPPPANGLVTISIWLGWSPDERAVFDQLLSSFQDSYPNYTFDVMYVPADELQSRYEAAAYAGRGPGLVFGPAAWGPAFYDQGLIADLSDLAAPEFLDRINPAALAQAQYRGALIGLPHKIDSAVVLYRNTTILPDAPATFNELVAQARAVTRSGIVGAYLERGFYFSAGHLYGLGGRLMDENGDPRFNDLRGQEWLNLLNDFARAGPYEFNANRDLELFKQGRVGLIIDGTWNLEALAQALGRANLAIDPWPSYGSGHLSGFIRTENIYVNANLNEQQRYGALLFTGFMLAPEVQNVLSEVGHIPVIVGAEVEDRLLNLAAEAALGGAAYPILPETNVYWDPLEAAMQAVFTQSSSPAAAMQRAHNAVLSAIAEIRKR